MAGAQLQFEIVAAADPRAVEDLSSKMDSLADSAHKANEEVRTLTQQLEEWRNKNAGGIAPGQQTSIYNPAAGGGLSGPGATIAMTGGGLATPAAMEELKAYGDRAAYITDVANKMKSELQQVEKQVEQSGMSMGTFTGRMRALRAAMYELTSAIPGLSQALTIFQYAGGGFAALGATVTLATLAIKDMINAWDSLQKAILEPHVVLGLKGVSSGWAEAMERAARSTKDWEQSLSRVLAHLQQVHQVSAATLDVSEKQAQRHEDLEAALGITTPIQRIIRQANLDSAKRKAGLAQQTGNEQEEELALFRSLSPDAQQRTVAQQTEVAALAGAEAARNKENEARLRAGIAQAQHAARSQTEAYNEKFGATSFTLNPNLNLAKTAVSQFSSYAEFRAEQDRLAQDPSRMGFSGGPGVIMAGSAADLYVQEAFKLQENIKIDEAAAQSFKGQLETTLGQRGPTEEAARRSAQDLTTMKTLDEMRGQHGAAQQVRAIEDKAADAAELQQTFLQVRETPEGSKFERAYNAYRKAYEDRQKMLPSAITAEQAQDAGRLMQRVTGRLLSGTDLQAAFTADIGSERYQKLIVAGAGASMSADAQKQMRAEFAEKHPYAPVAPQPYQEQLYDKALNDARDMSGQTHQTISLIGTYLEQSLTTMQMFQRQLDQLQRDSKDHTTRQQDALIPR